MNLVIPPETLFSTDLTMSGKSVRSASLKFPLASKTILSGLLSRYDEKVGFSSALSKITKKLSLSESVCNENRKRKVRKKLMILDD